MDYNTASESWSSTIFPTGDGAPYEAIGMDPNNGDIIIITSSDDKFVAEISAINTAIWTINN